MSQFHFDPDSYLAMMREDLPRYDELQETVAAATAGLEVRRILELGTGTGETARRLLTLHPGAVLVGIDASEAMLAVAQMSLGADLRVRRLEDPLPEGPFDLIVSALAVHHLDGAEKATSFGASVPSSHPADASCSPTSSCRNERKTSSRQPHLASTSRTRCRTCSRG